MSDSAHDFTANLKSFLVTVPAQCGVYRMLSSKKSVLYVGKARNLKKRLTSYFRRTGLTAKHLALMAQTETIEFTLTRNEGEALILENNLIKEHKPKYNVLLRDDKSYPYIYLASHESFPRLAFHRGARSAPGRFFGPFPNAGAVRDTLNLLQKLFRVRQCEDSFFRNRSRPCLQYQIKRCTAPCVGLVTVSEYQQDVTHALLFLEGRIQEVISALVQSMDQAAAAQDYEKAAHFRDKIQTLRVLSQGQDVDTEGGDADIVATGVSAGIACVQVFFIRGGRNLGEKTFFPRIPKEITPEEVLTEFLPQYYFAHSPPATIIVSHPVADANLLETLLQQRQGNAGSAVKITQVSRGQRASWLQMALTNTAFKLRTQIASLQGTQHRISALRHVLGLDKKPLESEWRIECFDISHTSGEETVASCVVFGAEGWLKSEFRRFNIKGITKSDDYAAMAQATERRLKRLVEEEQALPSILLIDGGKGQLAVVESVCNRLNLQGIFLLAVAKGVDRRVGQEQLFLSSVSAPIILPEESPALHLIQQIRDEAHRFAITGHRHRRQRKQTGSILDNIPGMGPKRRQLLLQQFGGAKLIERAGIDELASVKGISRELAERIFNTLHPET